MLILFYYLNKQKALPAIGTAHNSVPMKNPLIGMVEYSQGVRSSLEGLTKLLVAIYYL